LPGERSDASIFEIAQDFVSTDPLFRRIHDVDERRAA
jgi:hypothetical protein